MLFMLKHIRAEIPSIGSGIDRSWDCSCVDGVLVEALNN